MVIFQVTDQCFIIIYRAAPFPYSLQEDNSVTVDKKIFPLKIYLHILKIKSHLGIKSELVFSENRGVDAISIVPLPVTITLHSTRLAFTLVFFYGTILDFLIHHYYCQFPGQ